MAKFRKKPIVIEAITFDELVEFGKANCGPHLHNGMPWSFDYNGQPITHENDNCYLIPTLEGTMRFERGDWLITGVKGEIYPCKPDIFDKSYEPVVESCDVCGATDLQGTINGFPCWRCGQLWIEANLAKETHVDGLRTGRVVDYVLTIGDCQEIERQRKDAHLYGNHVVEGDHVPAVVVANWGSRDNQNPAANLKLLLDGPDTYWATSRVYSEEPKPGTWHWLERI